MTPPSKSISPVDLRSRDAVAQFRRAADTFGKTITGASDPQKAARDLMVREGIVTSKGRLTNKYK